MTTGRRKDDRFVAWEQQALDDLTEQLDLGLTSARVLRRLVLAADWRTRTVTIGHRTALATAWRMGTASGRRTIGLALDELIAKRCLHPLDKSTLEVSVYDVLVCSENRDKYERLSATWIRPTALHDVTEGSALTFMQRAVLEMLLTLADCSGELHGSYRDIAVRAHSARPRVIELTEVGVLERSPRGWRIVGFEDLVKRTAARDVGNGFSGSSFPESRAIFPRVARELSPSRAKSSPQRASAPSLSRDFGPLTITGTDELGAGAVDLGAGCPVEIVAADAGSMSDAEREAGLAKARAVRKQLHRGSGTATIDLTQSDQLEVSVSTGTEGR
jgi:hypothetical protein